MHIEAAGRTDRGQKREENEDTYVVDDALGLYGVCDGMGGHAAGEVAASVALEALCRTIRHRPWVLRHTDGPPERLTRLLDRAIETANADVFSLAQEYHYYHGMGCTATMLLCAGSLVVLASVGDSRFYRIREGRARQLTIDHTVGEEMKQSGAMTPEQIASFRYARLLSRAIGTHQTVRADTFVVDLVPGDRFVICTDGLSDYIDRTDQLAAQVASGTAEEIGDRLVAFANEAGGHDNITVVAGLVTD